CTSGEKGPERSDSSPILITPASWSTPMSVAMSPAAPSSPPPSPVSAVVSSLVSPAVSGVVSSAAGSVSAVVSSAPSPPPPPQAAASMARTTKSTQTLLRPLIFRLLLSVSSDSAEAEPAGPCGPTTRAPRRLFGHARLVGEWPALPVVADSQPDSVQAERLEDQEGDDQPAVDDEVELVDGQPGSDARRRVDQAPVAGARGHERVEDRGPHSAFRHQTLPQPSQVLHQPRQDDHERRAEERPRNGSHTADEDDGDELHGQQEIPLLGDRPADERGDQRPGDAGVERRDGEGDGLRPEVVDAHDLGGNIAVTDGHERSPGAGPLEVLRHEREDHRQDEDEEIGLRRRRHIQNPEPGGWLRHRQDGLLLLPEPEFEGWEGAPRMGATGDEAEVAPQVLTDEHEPQGDDRQVEAADPHRRRGDEYPEDRRNDP